jgi:hypothetical protein
MIQNLNATLFVFRHRQTEQIRCEYISAAAEVRVQEWEHLATLDPRMWIQYHWNDQADEREACAKLCDEMEQQAEGTECCKWPTPADCAHAIRARGQA